MSKSAGTLVTTNNATYINPRFMPGYKGYVPTVKYDCGETFGNQTSKYFQDFRRKALDSSRENKNRGGYFPTIFSQDGRLACEARTRSWERWLQMPTYRLNNQNCSDIKKQTRFLQLSMAHREHYTDKTGTVHGVEFFNIPKNYETREMFIGSSRKPSHACTHPGVTW